MVIPQDIREKLNLEEGNLLLATSTDNSLSLKKIELPPAKTWEEATRPFRIAAKKAKFSREDLDHLIEESKMRS